MLGTHIFPQIACYAISHLYVHFFVLDMSPFLCYPWFYPSTILQSSSLIVSSSIFKIFCRFPRTGCCCTNTWLVSFLLSGFGTSGGYSLMYGISTLMEGLYLCTGTGVLFGVTVDIHIICWRWKVIVLRWLTDDFCLDELHSNKKITQVFKLIIFNLYLSCDSNLIFYEYNRFVISIYFKRAHPI